MSRIYLGAIECARGVATRVVEAESTLSEEETRRARSICSPAARRRFVAGRWLARTMLSGLVDQPASGIQITISSNGRPVLAYGVPWDFGISHSGDLSACAVADLSIGVDLERATPSRSLLDLAREHFHVREVEDVEVLLSAGDEQAAAARFYAYWTLKEAHLKRRGGSVWDMKKAPAFPLGAGPGPIASGDALWSWCLRTRPQGSSPCAYVISLCAGRRSASEGCLNRPELHLMYLLAEEPEPCLLFRSAIDEQPEGRAGTR